MGVTRALLLAWSLALLACGGAQRVRERPASLRVVAVPAHATVQVDERFVGAARVLEKQPALLERGKRRVTIEAPGYFPHDLEVELVPGVTTVEIQLRPVPP
jgi:hypothetical protein